MWEHEGMGRALADAGRRGLALLVLLAVAWLVFKAVVGVATGLAWIAVAVLAIVAVVWALRVL